jgi:hypothetical protein
VRAAPPFTTVLGQSPTAAATVQPRSASTTAATCGSQATTTVYACRLSVLQLRENWPLRQGLSSAQARQCTSCSSYWGELDRGQQRSSAPWTGRVNYTIVDGIPTREEVLAGTFFVNERPIIILFDYGASHDFMSSACAKKARLTLVASGAPYVISTPGGRVDADRVVRKVPLNLSG